MFVKRNSLGYFPEFRSQSLKTSLSAPARRQAGTGRDELRIFGVQ